MTTPNRAAAETCIKCGHVGTDENGWCMTGRPYISNLSDSNQRSICACICEFAAVSERECLGCAAAHLGYNNQADRHTCQLPAPTVPPEGEAPAILSAEWLAEFETRGTPNIDINGGVYNCAGVGNWIGILKTERDAILAALHARSERSESQNSLRCACSHPEYAHFLALKTSQRMHCLACTACDKYQEGK